MSRSRKRTPISGNAEASEKRDKQNANRNLRRRTKSALLKEKEIPLLREVSDVWEMAKDGKKYLKSSTRKKYPKLMRK